MDEIGLTRKEIASLLIKHGDDFVCCKERAGSTYLNNTPEVRIASSGAAMRKQIDGGDFTMRVVVHRLIAPDKEMALWVVFLKAKFGARSPGGTLKSDLAYEVIAPAPPQLLALHQAGVVKTASKGRVLPPKKTIKDRKDTI
jgi:hypothetical protein